MQPEKSHSTIALVMHALHRARIPILTVALAYIIAVGIGMIMVHTGNEWAVVLRDRIVFRAQSSSSIVALKQNDRIRAAILDFGGNLYGAIIDTILGLGIIVPYPVIAYRGWVGGIVSIDSSHVSRFADLKEGAYYLITLTLQLIPYALSGGAGVNMGLANFRLQPFYQGEKWLWIPKEAVRDAFRIYLFVIPLFLLASLWEFFAR